MSTDFSFSLPPWIDSYIQKSNVSAPVLPHEKMKFVLGLVYHNIQHKTGGPFGAALFCRSTHALISCGVNLVPSANCSVLHAEIVAIMLAQKKLSTFNLSSYKPNGLELVTSTEPCAMCLGAIPWSGIRSLVCGATDADARACGFNEGDKPLNWQSGLIKRGISVQTEIARNEAYDLLKNYVATNGIVYNGGIDNKEQ